MLSQKFVTTSTSLSRVQRQRFLEEHPYRLARNNTFIKSQITGLNKQITRSLRPVDSKKTLVNIRILIC